MLTEEDKTRIKSEELFRHEVREGLKDSKPKTFWNNLWTFVNSNFGMWVMSTVVAGSFILIFSIVQQKLDSNKLRNESIDKIKTEVKSRMDFLFVQLMELEQDIVVADTSSGLDSIDLKELSIRLQNLAKSLDGSSIVNREASVTSNVFPDFKDRTIASLFYELQHLEDDKTHKERAAEFANNVYEVKMLFLSNPTNEISTPEGTKLHNVKKEIFHRIQQSKRAFADSSVRSYIYDGL